MNKPTRTLFALAALAPLLLAGRRAGDKIEYLPKPGTSLSKHVAIENEVELEKMSLEVDGQDMSQMAQVQMAMKTVMKVGVTDRYETVADGHPTKLVRAFDELSSTTHISMNNPALGQQEQDVPLESKLEGASVVFTWAGDGYETAFEGDKKADQSLLEGLTEDLDLRGFLPNHEVANGDTWSVPADAVKALLAPCGDIKLRPTEGSDSMSQSNQFSQNDMIGDLAGTFEATYGGTREEDGARVAVIHLKIDARSAKDMSGRLEEMKGQMKEHLPEGMSMDLSAMDAEYHLEAEGDLLWNPESGLAASLHMSGEMRMVIDMSMTMTVGGGDKDMDISQTFSGNQTLSFTTGD